MASLRDRTAIVGIGQTPFAKHLGISEAEVACLAVEAALADAGLAVRDVDGLCLYDIESNTVADTATLLGLEGLRFFATHSHGGGSYCALVQSAAAALVAGHATTVLCFRARNRGRRSSFGPGRSSPGKYSGRSHSSGRQFAGWNSNRRRVPRPARRPQ